MSIIFEQCVKQKNITKKLQHLLLPQFTLIILKGRTIKELHQVIEWLTGFNENKLSKLIEENVTFENFFDQAKLNSNAYLIKGVICGYKIEEIENPLTKKVRYLDKLIDELAKGKEMETILRK